MNDKYSYSNQQQEGFFSRMNREREEGEALLSEKQIENRKKQHDLAVLLSFGILYIVSEGLLAYVGNLIQKIGAYYVGVISNGRFTRGYYSYNHLYYTLGLVFFIGISLILYYVAFDKKIKAYLSRNMLYVVPLTICAGITVFAVWMSSVNSLIIFTDSRYLTSLVDISVYGEDYFLYIQIICEHLNSLVDISGCLPSSMTFLTMIGWPCFISLFAGVQLIKNMIIVSMEKKKKQKQ